MLKSKLQKKLRTEKSARILIVSIPCSKKQKMNLLCRIIGHKWTIKKRVQIDAMSAETVLVFPGCLRCGTVIPFKDFSHEREKSIEDYMELQAYYRDRADTVYAKDGDNQ